MRYIVGRTQSGRKGEREREREREGEREEEERHIVVREGKQVSE